MFSIACGLNVLVIFINSGTSVYNHDSDQAQSLGFQLIYNCFEILIHLSIAALITVSYVIKSEITLYNT